MRLKSFESLLTANRGRTDSVVNIDRLDELADYDKSDGDNEKRKASQQIVSKFSGRSMEETRKKQIQGAKDLEANIESQDRGQYFDPAKRRKE